jgi:hypothetical protein
MEEGKELEVLGGCLVATILMPFEMLLKGWVFTILWAWFIYPVFDVPELLLLPAMGLSVVIGYISPKSDSKEFTGFSNVLGRYITSAFIMPFMYLGIGWIVTLFM